MHDSRCMGGGGSRGMWEGGSVLVGVLVRLGIMWSSLEVGVLEEWLGEEILGPICCVEGDVVDGSKVGAVVVCGLVGSGS